MTPDDLIPWSYDRRSALAHGTSSGAVKRMRNGLYVPERALRDPELLLAVGSHVAGADGALSHETAARLLRFPGSWPLDPVHVSVPRPRHPRPSPGIVLHHPRTLDPRDIVTMTGGRRVVFTGRTLIDVAATSRRGDALISLLADLYRRKDLNPGLLERALERAGNGLGAKRVRAAAVELSPGFLSLAEVRFARQVRRTRMLQPQWAKWVETAHGWRCIDALFGRLAVEIKGRFHFMDATTWEDDMLREDDLAQLGLELLSLPARLALSDPVAAVARVQARLATMLP